MSVARLPNSTERTYSRQDFTTLSLLKRPVWIFDIQREAMWWANDAAIDLWDGGDLKALLARDFTSDMPEVTRSRLQKYLARFKAAEVITEQWTFHPNGSPVTVDCVCSGIRIDDGRTAMLVEGRENRDIQLRIDALRGVEALRYTPVMISMYDMEGRRLFGNPAASQAFTDQHGESTDFHRRFADTSEAHLCWGSVLTSRFAEGESRFLTSGGDRWHEYQCRLTEDPVSGEPAVLMSQQDVTERRKVEHRYRQMYRGNKAPMLLVDPEDGRLVDANRAAEAFYGYPGDTFLGMRITDINPLTPEQIKAEMAAARMENRSHFFFRHRLASGEVRDVEVLSGPVDIFGRQLLYSIVHDITDRRAAEQALKRSERKYRNLVNNTPVGFLLIDAQQRTLEVNASLCRILGYPEEELIGHLPQEFMDAENAEIFRAQVAKIPTNEHRSYEICLKHKSGHNLPVHFGATTLRDQNGRIDGSFAFVTDLRDLKQAEQRIRQSEERFRSAFDDAAIGMVLLTNERRIFRMNRTFCDMLDYQEVELARMPFLELIHGDDREQIAHTLQRLFHGACHRDQQELRFRRRDGSDVWSFVNAALVRDDDDRPMYAILQVEDITERKIIVSSLEKLSRAVEHSGSSIIITDHRHRIEYVNPHFTTLTGYGYDEVVGKTPALLRSGTQPPEIYQKIHDTIRRGLTWQGELQNVKKNGEFYWTLLTISPIRNDSGELTHYVGVGEDVTALKDAYAKAERLSLFDSLTGLANRRLFSDRLSQSVKSAKRADVPTALLYLDLDRFKDINDSLGHETGDQVLVEVARRLRDCVRDGDTVARLGGDEFSILLPGIGSANDTRKVARKILDLLSHPLECTGLHAPITSSIGITLTPADSLEPEVLMRNADLAMYSAKAKGKNTYQFFTDSMNREVSERLNIERELRLALEYGGLELHYQPIVRLSDQRIVGAEALARWNHPELGMIPPDRFIPVAEESDLIITLGEWVLATACRDICRPGQAPLGLESLCINISARHFLQPRFCDKVAEAMEVLGPDAPMLKLELTESALMEQTDIAIATLRKLQEQGVKLSIDDFGTGYSSLSYLKRFPVDTLKIDRSFVTDIPQDANDMEIVGAIIAMAGKLGLDSVAEGIENELQLQFLHANQCLYGQGYLFGKPMPIHKLIKYLESQAGTTGDP